MGNKKKQSHVQSICSFQIKKRILRRLPINIFSRRSA